jgi:thioredoxin-related protein
LHRIDVKDELIESQSNSVIQVPTTSDIQNIEVYRLQQNPNVGGKYMIVIFATNSSLFCMTGPDDLGILFRRFEDKN